MRIVRERIAARAAEFSNHAFFRRLERDEPAEHVMAFISVPTFFVLTFQDILRLNTARVTDPHLRRIAEHHRREDNGHDHWFLHDVAAVEGSDRDIRWLFGPSHERTRDVGYALVSEVFRASDDRLRIALPLVLEASGHVVFSKMADYLERVGYARPLAYFSRKHLDVELSHELFGGSIEEDIDAIVLPPELRAEAFAMVDRAFLAMTALVDGFEERVAHAERGKPSSPPAEASLPAAE